MEAEQPKKTAQEQGVLGASEELIDLAADMVARQVAKSKIKKTLRQVLDTPDHQVSHQLLERVISAAKARLRELAARGADDVRAEALGLLRQTIADEDTPVMARLKAQEQLTDMLGIGAKFNQNLGEDYLERARSIREAMQAAEENENAPQ